MTADSFAQFVVDQLRHIGPVECRAMFGGHGLYTGDVFFGIVWRGRFFLKTDGESRQPYVQRGMTPFRPNEKQTLKNYYEVPVEVIENDEELTAWARRAIQCAGGG